jgi:hypothetical protein
MKKEKPEKPPKRIVTGGLTDTDDDDEPVAESFKKKGSKVSTQSPCTCRCCGSTGLGHLLKCPWHAC